jgi:hypothetical protein
MPSPNELRRLEAEAQYHRNRAALYRARALTGKPVTDGRLRELERISAGAEARLRDAKAA